MLPYVVFNIYSIFTLNTCIQYMSVLDTLDTFAVLHACPSIKKKKKKNVNAPSTHDTTLIRL